MNPIVLGALIGGVPALIAGALATWATLRTTSRTTHASLLQTRLTLRADHERWLREKRGELYPDLIAWVQHAGHQRVYQITGRDMTPELAAEVQRVLSSYHAPEWFSLVARTQTYASPEVIVTFLAASEADRAAWKLAGQAQASGPVPADLAQAMDLASDKAADLAELIRHDLMGEIAEDDIRFNRTKG